jgi:hypothetical protein
MKSLRKSENVNIAVRFCKLNRGIARLLSFSFVVIILSHFAACLWYYIARLNDFDYETWVFRYEMINDTKARLYLVSLYWAFTTLTTVGYGDITAFSSDEITFSLIWMLFGVGIYSFIIGSLTSVLSNYDARQIVIDKRIKMFEVYGKENDVPPGLLGEINNFLSSNNDVTVLDENDKKELLMSVPKRFRLRIAMSFHKSAANIIDFIK